MSGLSAALTPARKPATMSIGNSGGPKSRFAFAASVATASSIVTQPADAEQKN
jgi:hypothetical protein